MTTQVVTLDSTYTLALPLETAAAFGLHAGSRLAVSVKDGKILLQPLLANSVDELHGIFPLETDLVEELQGERRQDKW